MGGRGQRANARPRGAGAKIKLISANDLISMRERKRLEVDDTLQALREIEKDFGERVNELSIANLDKSNAGVLAFSDGDNISFNNMYFNDNSMTQAYAASVKDGFHPSSGNKTALQAVLAHEMGHVLTQRAASKTGNLFTADIDSMSTAIVKEARKMTGHRGVVQMAAKISGYARYSNAEAVAESVADVYCNGNKAKAESKAIVNVLNRYLKKGK